MALTEQEMRQQADITAEALTRVLNAQGRTGATSGATTAASGGGMGGNWSGALNMFNQGLGGSVNVLRGFTTGTFTASKALDTFGSIAGQFGPAGTALKTALTGVGGGVIDVNNSLKAASQNGLYFGQNLGLYDRAILNSRMSLDEFNVLIRDNNKSLNGMGANVDYAALTYLKLGKKLQDDPLTYSLAATGMGFDEFNKTLLTSASMNRNLDFTKKANQDVVLASAMELAVELDNVARLTGKNRAVMQREMEERQSKVSTQLALAAMTAEQKLGAEKGIIAAEAYGENAKKVAEIMAKGGPMNKTETETVAGMDPKMTALLSQLVKVEGTGEEQNKRRAQIKMEMDLRAEEIALDKAGLKSKVALAESGNKVAEGTAKSAAELYNAGTRTNQQRMAAEKEGLTLIQWKTREEERIEKDRLAAISGKPASGSEGQAAVTARTINQADILMKDISKGVAVGFDALNTKLGSTISGVEGLNKVLRPFTDAQMEAAARNLANTVIPKAPGRRNTSTVQTPPVESNAIGTKDNYGSWFAKDWGDGGLSKLHGKEAIVPEGKIGEFINDMMQTAKMPTGQITSGQVPNIFGNATNDLKGELAKVKDMMPTNASFEKIFSQFKMPDFGEITRNMPQVAAPNRAPSVDNEAINAMATGIASLNTRMERLISAVTDGSDKSVRALKTRGNALS